MENYKTLSGNKEYFSAYLIMAQHNAYITLNDIAKTIFGKEQEIDKDSSLSKSNVFLALAENKTDNKYLPPQTPEKIIEKLRRHFPFVDPMLQKELRIGNRTDLQPNDFLTLFATLLDCLDTFRNYYTHTNHEIYKNSDDLLRYLRSSFDAAVRKVRVDMEIEESEIDFLRRLKKKRGEKYATEKEEFEYKFYDEENKNISEKGLAYFICLFLEPKYSMLFLKKLKGFKRDDENRYQLIHNCYRCYSIRLPQPRLSSDNTKESLAMDILNELKRCPSELFKHVDKSDKEKFFYNKNMSEEEIEKNPDDEETEIVQKLIRKEDRFPFFAFRYIDYQELFSKLRFQIDLGDYYYKFYEKETVDNKIHLRSLNKKMKAYGRIQDFDAEKQPDWWKKLCKQTHSILAGECEQYITETQPHYHVNNHLIALAATDKFNNHSFPEADPETKRIVPDFFLSTHELLGLLFYNYLLKKEGNNEDTMGPAERLIFNHRKKLNRFFNDIIDGKLTKCSEEKLNNDYGLTKREIPEQLLLLLGVKEKTNSQETIQKQKLEQMIRETEMLLRRSKNDEQKAKNSKAGNYKKEKIIKSGDYASYLAKDMVFLQKTPETTQNHKITSLNFQVLQSSLAFYGRDKKLLPKIFEQCNFFNEKMAHPFLKRVCEVCMKDEKKNSIVNFYQTYLQERINYLNRCKNNLSQCHFFKSKNEVELKELVQTYKIFPVNLPRGLFKTAIVKHFKTGCCGDTMKAIACNDKTATSFLIEQYFLHCLNDKPLDYYNFKRTYDVINKKEDDRKEFHNKQFCDNEKTIRTYKAQDMMSFLMGKELLFKEEGEADFKLKDILFDNTDNRSKGKGEETRKDILSTPRHYEIKIHNKIVFQKDLKPKNYGDFRRFLKDRRLPSLFDWIEEETIERKRLEKELESYDKARMTILEQVHRFERAMFEKYFAELEKCKQSSKRDATKSYYAFNVILDAYQSVHSLEDGDKNFIKEIRNSFSHNQYPKKHLFSSEQVKQVNRGQITEDIKKIAIDKLQTLINTIPHDF